MKTFKNIFLGLIKLFLCLTIYFGSLIIRIGLLSVFVVTLVIKSIIGIFSRIIFKILFVLSIIGIVMSICNFNNSPEFAPITLILSVALFAFAILSLLACPLLEALSYFLENTNFAIKDYSLSKFDIFIDWCKNTYTETKKTKINKTNLLISSKTNTVTSSYNSFQDFYNSCNGNGKAFFENMSTLMNSN